MKKDKLSQMLIDKCSLQKFVNEVQGSVRTIYDLDTFLFDDGQLLSEIFYRKRIDIFKWVWIEGYHFDLFKRKSMLCNQSVFSSCTKDMQEYILKACFDIKLYKDALDIVQMDTHSILSVHACDIKKLLKINSFTDKNRQKLQDFCNEYDLKYAVVDKILTEHGFYGRILYEVKKNAKKHHEIMSRLPEYSKTQQESQDWLVNTYKRLFCNLKFKNEAVYSDSCLLFIKNGFTGNFELMQNNLAIENL